MEYLSDVFPQNSLNEDPNLRGEVPVVHQLVRIDPGALVLGTVDVEVKSIVGKGKGEVLGIIPLATEQGEAFGCSVATSATDDQVTVTVTSSDLTSTTNLTAFYALIVGRILPLDV